MDLLLMNVLINEARIEALKLGVPLKQEPAEFFGDRVIFRAKGGKLSVRLDKGEATFKPSLLAKLLG